jgi:hypothetical protein
MDNAFAAALLIGRGPKTRLNPISSRHRL